MTVKRENLQIVPATISEAKEFVRRHHRTHRPPIGGLFAVAVARGKDVVGVAIVGRPVARRLQDARAVEVTRVAVADDQPNACSMLYGACWRAAKALGWCRLVTYTLSSEPGTSLRASGWREVARVTGRSWSCESRPRVDMHPLQDKIRWEVEQ